MKHIRHATSAVLLIVAVLATSLAIVGVAPMEAGAAGPAYSGPQTVANGPAYFGPAPNPLPYCESPTYFDPWVDNVTPTGRLDVGDTAQAVAPGMTMVLEIDGEGDPGGQYPGFFPFGGEGVGNDQAKGFEVGPGDSATVTLSQPLFFSQFVFTDVDRPGKGFEVAPDWAAVGDVVAYGGDGQFSFAGTTNLAVVLDDLDGVDHPAESLNGRVQIDMLGAINGVSFQRPATHVDPDTGAVVPAEGESGLAAVGGCEASGIAKAVVAGPTWSGDSFEVTYELRVRNNLPTETTILDVVEAAQTNAQSTVLTASPSSLALADLGLQDQLADDAFSAVVVTDVSTSTPNLVLNQNYDGLGDDELLDAASFLAAETDALISLTVEYTPDEGRIEWANCAVGYDHSNQAQVSGTVAGIAVVDLSDDGTDPSPSSVNGAGGVDDPTPVLFPCIPADQPELEIVKTVLPGPGVPCPSFASGVQGRGVPFAVVDQDTVTYCITVRNVGEGDATSVVITDDQAPQDYAVGTLVSGRQVTVGYLLQVDLATPAVNVAFVNGDGPDGPVAQASDDAEIAVSSADPALEIVKTALVGPDAPCPSFANGAAGPGRVRRVADGDSVTFCISVRNLGPGIATNVVVGDGQASGSFELGTLLSGAEQTVSYDVAVNLATPTTTAATVDGDGPAGPVEQVADTAVIAIDPLPEPSLEIVKTALRGPNAGCPGFDGGIAGLGDAVEFVETETVTYCISVRNTGEGDATGVVISDEQAPNIFGFEIGALDAGAEATRSFELEVSLQTEPVNTAFVNGDGPYGAVSQMSDQALISVQQQSDPVLEIVKTVVAGPGGTCPAFGDGVPGDGSALPVLYGDVVTYCLSIVNSGETNASSVQVNDLQAPGVLSIGGLAVDEEVNRTYDVLIDSQTPAQNTATVTGTGPNGQLPAVADTALIAASPQPDPVLEIVKAVVPGPAGICPRFDESAAGIGEALNVELGDTVTYCISIRNNGPRDAVNVVITDDQAPGAFEIGTLVAGETLDRSYDVLIAAGTPLVTMAVVSGDGPNGALPEAGASARVEMAEIELVHTVIGADRDCDDAVPGVDILAADLAGRDVRWCYQMTNSGSVALTNLQLSSSGIGFDDLDVLANAGGSFIVDSGGELVLVGSAVVRAAGSRSNASAITQPGDIVLMPGDSLSIDVRTAIPAGGVVSVTEVIAEASDINGNLLGLDPVITRSEVAVREGQIQLDKTVAAGTNADCALAVAEIVIPVGEPVTWCFTVTNTGTLDVALTEIVDETLETTIVVPADFRVLAPGAAFTTWAASESPGPIVNLASIEGLSLDTEGAVVEQAPIVRDEGTAEILLLQADLSISKEVSNRDPVSIGDVLIYTLRVTNKGPDAAAGVEVADVLPDGMEYLALPNLSGWTCSRDDDRGFLCLKETDMAADETTSFFFYTVEVTGSGGAVAEADRKDVATVEAITDDPDETNNADTEVTHTVVLVTPAEPVVTASPIVLTGFEATDQVLGLAITGSSARQLGLLSVSMVALGVTMMVGARRIRTKSDY